MKLISEHFKGNYHIEVDSNQYIPRKLVVSQKEDIKGKENWYNLGFYTSLGAAIRSILREDFISAGGEVELKTYVDTLVNNTNKILKELDI